MWILLYVSSGRALRSVGAWNWTVLLAHISATGPSLRCHKPAKEIRGKFVQETVSKQVEGNCSIKTTPLYYLLVVPYVYVHASLLSYTPNDLKTTHFVMQLEMTN